MIRSGVSSSNITTSSTDAKARVLIDQRPAVTLDLAHGLVAVYSDDQFGPEFLCSFEQIDMTRMQNVEAAVSENYHCEREVLNLTVSKYKVFFPRPHSTAYTVCAAIDPLASLSRLCRTCSSIHS